jgi:hypothetical protein
MCQLQAYWTAPFLPNLLNSVCFLVETSQMISVYFANYKGFLYFFFFYLLLLI